MHQSRKLLLSSQLLNLLRIGILYHLFYSDFIFSFILLIKALYLGKEELCANILSCQEGGKLHLLNSLRGFRLFSACFLSLCLSCRSTALLAFRLGCIVRTARQRKPQD